jgi:hypothetical protein
MVTLGEGETAKLSIDLSAILPGTLEALVLYNGTPLAKQDVVVRAGDGTVPMQLPTDDEGNLRVLVRPGEYWLTWFVLKRGVGTWNWRTAENATVVSGQTTVQTFHINTAILRVRLLDGQGQPVAGVPIILRSATDEVRGPLPPTDADGIVQREVETETLTAYVMPKRLQSPEAQSEVYRNNPGDPDPLVGLRIRLGTVRAKAGDTGAIELRLPPEWAR